MDGEDAKKLSGARRLITAKTPLSKGAQDARDLDLALGQRP